VKALALGLGFDLAGIAEARPTPESAFFREWLARGFAGEMAYLGRRVEERVDPRRLLEGARSIVALGFVYDPGPRGPLPEGALEVARYAGGDDYHDVLIDRVRAFEAALPALADAPVRSRGYVDTGPVLERVFAREAGLGWIGKNTCLIHPGLGSYLFLAVVLTDLALESDTPEPDHCGSCRACLDVCPTHAFPEPYVLDATRCISYTTIESREAIPEALREAHGTWGFGCDLCQEVCPWNLRERRDSIAWVLDLDEDRWREAARKTALKRTRYRGLMRNALVAAGNSGDPALAPHVRRHAEGADPLLAEHARWALAQLET
jgi:epoxyqueuosine reductase